MSEIKLQPDEARQYASDVLTTKEDVAGDLGDLRGRMNNLTDSFTGKTQEAFMGKLDEWKAANDDLLEALEQLGQFLNDAATTIEDVDTQLAAKLG